MKSYWSGIASKWNKFCVESKIDAKTGLSNEEVVLRFIGQFPKRRQSACRSALRNHAAEIGVQDHRSIGSSWIIPRNKPVPKKKVGKKEAGAIEALVASRTYVDVPAYAVLSLVVSGVTPSYIRMMRCDLIAERIDPSGISLLVPSKRGGKMVVISGVYARAVKARMNDARSAGHAFLFSGHKGVPYSRQAIYKMIESTGVFGIIGVDGRNIVGAVKKEILVSDGNVLKGKEAAASQVAEAIGRKPVYDPGTGKMRVLVGGDKWIETEVHQGFVDELRKQGYTDVQASSVHPSEKIMEAAGQVCFERIEMATKIAAGLGPVADMNPDQAVNIMAQSMKECFSRIGSDPTAIVDVIDQVMASIILQRALVISGKRTP